MAVASLQLWRRFYTQLCRMKKETKKGRRKEKSPDENLDVSEETFRNLSETAFDAILLADESGNITFWNQGAEVIFGYAITEALGKPLTMIMPEKYHVLHANGMKRFLATGEKRVIGQVISMEGRRKNGEIFPIDLSITSWKRGDEVHFSGIIRDMTHQKIADEKIRALNAELEQRVADRTAQLNDQISKLEESEERFQRAFQASAAAISMTRLSDSTFLDVNGTFVEMTGYSRQELIGHTSGEYGLIVDFAKRNEVLAMVREQGAAKGIELTVRTKSGELKEVLASIETFMLKGEKYAINFIIDITDRLKMERALRSSEARFTQLMDVAPVSITLSNAEGKIIDANQAAVDILGFSSREELLSLPAGKGYVEEKYTEAIAEKLRLGPVNNFELMAHRKDGRSVWLTTNVFPITDAEGNINFLSAALDITELKKRDEQLRDANKQLESFSYSVSHDLRAPLRLVSGYASMLEEDYLDKLDDEGRKMVRTIQKGVNRMNKLIDDLLDFARLGRNDIEKILVDMHALARQAAHDQKVAAGSEAVIQIGPLPNVYGDESLLLQVWTNLISNAIKYSSKVSEPLVEIGCEKKDGEIIFSVHDNGVGFDMQYADRLFNVFQRLHSVEEFPGTGVGLALVNRIMTKHGGKVWVEAEVNKGATFFFSLPDAGPID